MTSALQQLPEGYCEIWRADLQKNKKQALAVNGLALGLGAAMLAPFLYGIFQPLSSGGIHFHVTQFLAMLAGLLAYIPLHELVHGLCMKYFGAKKVRYGYTGLYAWAGSSAACLLGGGAGLPVRRCAGTVVLGTLSGAGGECLRRGRRPLYHLEGPAHAGRGFDSGYRHRDGLLCPAGTRLKPGGGAALFPVSPAAPGTAAIFRISTGKSGQKVLTSPAFFYIITHAPFLAVHIWRYSSVG